MGTEPNILRKISNDPYNFSIPNDQYLCPECKNVPELTNIYTDIGYIEFKCKVHEPITLTVKEYFEKFKSSEFNYYNFKCKNCNKLQKDIIRNGNALFKYCYKCKGIYCLECCRNHKEKDDCDINYCIDVNKINTRCLKHFDEGNFNRFCFDDRENTCEKDLDIKHRGHNVKGFLSIENEKEVIKEKNKVLKDLIRFNNIILNTYDEHPENYYHGMNVKMLANLIQLENSRKPKELENAYKVLEINMKKRKKAIEEFKAKFNIEINGNKENLVLKNKGLDDTALKIISKIGLLNLKILDISFNKIKNIGYFEHFFSGLLEELIANDNKIEDIEVLEEMDLGNLKKLYLQNNIIKNVASLVKVNMPILELLRIDGNNDLEPSMKEMQELIKKYEKRIIQIVQNLDDFNKKYGLKLKKNSKILEINGNTKGNIILEDLYILLPEENEIIELRLIECKIDDISYISRISMPKLEKIDLSFNRIIHIEPLCNLRKNKLSSLYLNDNNISDISPLKKIKFYGDNITIHIENNNLIKDSIEVQDVLEELKAKKIKVKIEENK